MVEVNRHPCTHSNAFGNISNDITPTFWDKLCSAWEALHRKWNEIILDVNN